MKNVRFVGLDVHAETIAAAVAEPDGEVRSLGVIANRIEAVKKLLKKLGEPEQLRVCYEAGPTGYVLYWQLTQLGVKCCVIAPNLVPMKATDRIKTDRRDAERLARSFRAEDLTPVWIPDAAHEALRDLQRAQGSACIYSCVSNRLVELIRDGRIFRIELTLAQAYNIGMRSYAHRSERLDASATLRVAHTRRPRLEPRKSYNE